MNMKINAKLLKTLRLEKSWSQDQLAGISSISLRTVQRIEKSGNCSLESKKAIASAFDMKACQFDMKDKNSAFSDEKSNRFYFRIENGTQLSEIIGGAYAYQLSHDDPKSKEEAELLSWSAQSIQEWGGIWSCLESGNRIEAAFDLSELIKSLESNGFWIFGVRSNEESSLIGNNKWPVASIFLIREDNPKIIKLNLEDKG